MSPFKNIIVTELTTPMATVGDFMEDSAVTATPAEGWSQDLV